MTISKSWHIQINDTNYFIELRENNQFYVLSNLEDPTFLLKIPVQDLKGLLKDLNKVASSSNFPQNKSSLDFNTLSDKEKELYQELKLWRYKLAKDKKIPPYIIMNNHSLFQIIKLKELNEINFLKIHGIGKAKFQSYFKDIKRIFDLKNNL